MRDLEQIYLDHLQQIAGIISYKLETTPDPPKPAYDATITLQTKTGEQRLFALEYRSHLTHKTADHIITQARQQSPQPLLLLAPSIGVPLGAKLANAGINYLDRSGNCHIAIGALYVHVEGRTAPPQPSTDKGLRSAGYQVLFCFLGDPALINATVRVVATAAGVSRQPVSDTKRRLLDDEYIVKTGHGFRWIPRRQQDALSLWLHGYETTVRPSLVWGAYRTSDASPEDLENRIVSTFNDVGISEFRWGGSAAGFRLTEYYRGERTIVHVHATPGDLRQRLRMLSDPRGNLVLMNAFGEINWQVDQQTVHPLLVYSEMLREKSERAHEAAQEVFDKHVQPLWSNAA